MKRLRGISDVLRALFSGPACGALWCLCRAFDQSTKRLASEDAKRDSSITPTSPDSGSGDHDRARDEVLALQLRSIRSMSATNSFARRAALSTWIFIAAEHRSEENPAQRGA